MPQPLVIAYHLIWTAYGWWLPNDSRGSGSHTIRNDLLSELGKLHLGRKTVQPAGRIIREFYHDAQDLLKHALLIFDTQAQAEIAAAFAEVIATQSLTCYACAIMPDHVHVVIRKHRLSAEEMIERLQEASRARLVATGLGGTLHPTWGGHGWKVFLDHPDEVRRTNRYVELNPEKIGLARQEWPFVLPYDGWPLHPGHSANSPYVRALRAAGRYP